MPFFSAARATSVSYTYSVFADSPRIWLAAFCASRIARTIVAAPPAPSPIAYTPGLLVSIVSALRTGCPFSLTSMRFFSYNMLSTRSPRDAMIVSAGI